MLRFILAKNFFSFKLENFSENFIFKSAKLKNLKRR